MIKIINKGDTLQPIIKVLKVKNGIPTSISFDGNQYALVHPNSLKGAKK